MDIYIVEEEKSRFRPFLAEEYLDNRSDLILKAIRKGFDQDIWSFALIKVTFFCGLNYLLQKILPKNPVPECLTWQFPFDSQQEINQKLQFSLIPLCSLVEKQRFYLEVLVFGTARFRAQTVWTTVAKSLFPLIHSEVVTLMLLFNKTLCAEDNVISFVAIITKYGWVDWLLHFSSVSLLQMGPSKGAGSYFKALKYYSALEEKYSSLCRRGSISKRSEMES